MAVRLVPLNWRLSLDDGTFSISDSAAAINFYLAGSGVTPPATVYTNKELTTGATVSVGIDSEGYPEDVNVWGSDDVSYKVGIKCGGFNGGVEKFFDYLTVAADNAAGTTDTTTAFKSALNNGGFTNWTGGTSFSNISGAAAAVEIADDWFFSQNNTASNSISRQTADTVGARYALQFGRPAASVSTEQLRVYQALPTDIAYRYKGKTATVSFSVKKGADFSGSGLAVLMASGTTEGESGNLMATGAWGGQVNLLSVTQSLNTTITRYQFSGVVASNVKELGLQLAYTPTGVAGANDWVQIENFQWEDADAATDFEARPEPIEFLLANLSASGRVLAAAGAAAAGKYPLFSSASAVVLADAINPNLIINGDIAVNLDGPSTSADDTYALTLWNILTQTGTVAVTRQTAQENGQPFNGRITQSQASAQRFGFEQIIERGDCQDLRGSNVTFSGRVRLSVSANVRIAILEWTGTADSVTSDVVNDWTSSTYTAGNFFAATTLNVLGVSAAIALTANTWTDLTALTAAVGSSANNLIVFCWTEATQAQNVTLDFGKMKLEPGSVATKFVPDRKGDTLRRVSRFFQKSFSETTVPAQSVGAGTGEYRFPAQQAGANTNRVGKIMFPYGPMISSPTLTLYNPAAANAQVRDLSAGADCSASSVLSSDENGFIVTTTGNASTTVASTLGIHWRADQRL